MIIIIIIIITEYTKQMCTIHLLTACNTNSPYVPEQQYFPPSQLQFIYQIWHHMVWNILLASFNQLSWLCSLSVFCAPGTSWEANILLVLNPKHSYEKENSLYLGPNLDKLLGKKKVAVLLDVAGGSALGQQDLMWGLVLLLVHPYPWAWSCLFLRPSPPWD